MRLTKAVREEVLDSIVHYKLGERKERLLGVMSAHAFNSIVDHGIKAAGFPVGIFVNPQKGLFGSWTNVAPKSQHTKHHDAFRGWGRTDNEYITHSDARPSGEKRFVPHVMGQTYHSDVFNYTEGDIPGLDSFVDEALALEKEFKQIKREVMAILNSATTLKRLDEAWPEARQFFPAEAQKRMAKPPVIQTGSVNALLGI